MDPNSSNTAPQNIVTTDPKPSEARRGARGKGKGKGKAKGPQGKKAEKVSAKVPDATSSQPPDPSSVTANSVKPVNGAGPVVPDPADVGNSQKQTPPQPKQGGLRASGPGRRPRHAPAPSPETTAPVKGPGECKPQPMQPEPEVIPLKPVPNAARPRLQPDVKELLQQRVREALQGRTEPKPALKPHQKQLEVPNIHAMDPNASNMAPQNIVPTDPQPHEARRGARGKGKAKGPQGKKAQVSAKVPDASSSQPDPPSVPMNSVKPVNGAAIVTPAPADVVNAQKQPPLGPMKGGLRASGPSRHPSRAHAPSPEATGSVKEIEECKSQPVEPEPEVMPVKSTSTAAPPRLQPGVKELLEQHVREARQGRAEPKPEARPPQKQREVVKAQQDEQDEAEAEEDEDEAESVTGEDTKEVRPDEKQEDQPKRKAKKKKASKAEKAAKQDAHFQLVLEAARAVVRILTDRGFSCAVFGSLAARLYGSYRCPKDVDMLIFQDPSIPPEQQLTAEQLKVLFLDASPAHFFLTLPRNPEDTYRILHYRREYLGAECKVDILVPGTMYLPSSFPPHPNGCARYAEGIPLVPFGLLLLHKLQGWDDHRLAEEEFRQKKQVQDAADVKKILAMEGEVQRLLQDASSSSTSQVEELWWRDEVLFCEEFQVLTERRVNDYCKEFPNLAKPWKSLGFVVPDPEPRARPGSKQPPPPRDAQEQGLSPPITHELEIRQNGAPLKGTESESVAVQLPPVIEVPDGMVTQGTLCTPGPDDPLSPDELVVRVGALTSAPELMPIRSG